MYDIPDLQKVAKTGWFVVVISNPNVFGSINETKSFSSGISETGKNNMWTCSNHNKNINELYYKLLIYSANSK